MLPACLQRGQLRFGIYLEVIDWIVHGIDVAGLTRKVEQVILVPHQISHGISVSYITDIKCESSTELVGKY